MIQGARRHGGMQADTRAAPPPRCFTLHLRGVAVKTIRVRRPGGEPFEVPEDDWVGWVEHEDVIELRSGEAGGFYRVLAVVEGEDVLEIQLGEHSSGLAGGMGTGFLKERRNMSSRRARDAYARPSHCLRP